MDLTSILIKMRRSSRTILISKRSRAVKITCNRIETILLGSKREERKIIGVEGEDSRINKGISNGLKIMRLTSHFKSLNLTVEDKRDHMNKTPIKYSPRGRILEEANDETSKILLSIFISIRI